MSVGRAREDDTGIGRLTISRIPCARLTPSSSIYEEGRQRVKREAGRSFTKNRRGRLCHRSMETHTRDGSWCPSELCAAMATAAPAPLFTLAVTVLRGFLVPSRIHVSPRRWRWLSAIIHLAPSLHPGPQLPLLVVQTKLSPQEIWGPLTYPPGPLISTQPLELCHPQYGS